MIVMPGFLKDLCYILQCLHGISLRYCETSRRWIISANCILSIQFEKTKFPQLVIITLPNSPVVSVWLESYLQPRREDYANAVVFVMNSFTQLTGKLVLSRILTYILFLFATSFWSLCICSFFCQATVVSITKIIYSTQTYNVYLVFARGAGLIFYYIRVVFSPFLMA